ncbi:hypothetical protein [Ruegeria faecimaris]|uniref:Lipoprotein n=1 Tax=Ruegeria faecimaris TaxID=686389 RepID=A0A521DAL0_9RHOB|nr:hypothetical protein [Ruegeria faecimaris]SMO68766.1 hypothetical protein SAMN06265380_105178 [Ruegeria faecimaris]
MQKKVLGLFVLTAVVLLSACDKSAETYPVSGEQCGPNDPVKTLDAEDCFIPPAGA